MGRLPVRAAEHNAVFPAGCGKEEVSETCTVITTLLDHQTAPADQVRDAYLTRWSSCETTFGEDKATITGAGNRTSGPVLRSGRPRLVISEAWAWLTGTQLTRASAAAALDSEHAAARALRRENARPATSDEESFTAAWRRAVRSMTTTQVTAASSLQAIAAAGESAARACTPSASQAGSGTPNASRKHARNSRIPPPSSTPLPENRTSPCSRPASTESAPRPCDRKEDTARGPWNRAPNRRDTRNTATPSAHPETGIQTKEEHKTSIGQKNLKT